MAKTVDLPAICSPFWRMSSWNFKPASSAVFRASCGESATTSCVTSSTCCAAVTLPSLALLLARASWRRARATEVEVVHPAKIERPCSANGAAHAPWNLRIRGARCICMPSANCGPGICNRSLSEIARGSETLSKNASTSQAVMMAVRPSSAAVSMVSSLAAASSSADLPGAAESVLWAVRASHSLSPGDRSFMTSR